MKFDNNIFSFLNGQNFSNGLEIKIGNHEKLINSRFNFLETLVTGKDIIHLGCCDHIDLINEKIKNNTWLHKRLVENANKCYGIDINKEGIEHLKHNLGYEYVVAADILNDKLDEIVLNKWEYLLMGEILEHIDNPVSFLNTIRERFTNNINKIVITVPNAFCYLNISNVYKNIEQINSDHRYWFTPYTLAKVLTEAGYTIDEYYFAQEVNEKIGLRAKLKIIPYIKRKIFYNKLKKYPGLRDTLIFTAKLK